MGNNLQQFAYLLDNDNYMVENKIFIDLMWHIAKEKMTSTDTKGRIFITAKSYVIRNAGVMFQQIFYWHFNAIKQGKTTKYKYKGKNTVKMDFEDWWNGCRLTDKEVSTANKFLIDSKLIEIQKMRIKQKDSEVFKPSNCYIINTEELEKYLLNIIDINKNMYAEKVIRVREENIKTSIKSKKSSSLSTDLLVTPITAVTSKSSTPDDMTGKLSTVSTVSTGQDYGKPDSVTPVTDVTIDTPVTDVTIDTPVTDVTNKSNTSYSYSSYTINQIKKSTLLSYSALLENIKPKMTDISFNTWIQNGIKDLTVSDNTISIIAANDFAKNILENKYTDIISKAAMEITKQKYNIKYKI